ncbi:hypothetical protein ANCDUO_26931, partial [Ancylostoma duodenale]
MRYTKVLSECYSGCTTVFRPFLNDIGVSVETGVRQGDPRAWSRHLRFADNIVLITRSPDDVSEMLRLLDEEGSEAGLNISTTKTK